MIPEDFISYLKQISVAAFPVLNSNISKDEYIAIDLSSTNKDLQKVDLSSPVAFQKYINKYLNIHQKKVAFGGYLEKRNLYKRSSYFNTQNEKSERNIHLGLDFWIASGTKVYAPLPAKVHSFKNNSQMGDYGPTIILEHQINNVVFYTLYGHLSLQSIQNLQVGAIFNAGDCIATLGDANVNGNYAPHLHFQVIQNMGKNFGDYPGVCSENTLEEYAKNCPNPNYILNLSFV